MSLSQDFIDAFSYATVKVRVNKFHPKHSTRTYRKIYKAHPFVIRMCWILRRCIRIKPWVEAFYPDDDDPIYMWDHNTMYFGERHFNLLKGKTKCNTK